MDIYNKVKADGSIERYKARFVEKRFYTDLWNQLLGKFHSNSQNKLNPSFIVFGCEFQLAFTSARYKKFLPKQGFRRGSFYELTTWF